MAEKEGQEKVHDPTQKRIDEYRDEGRIAQSKDIGSTAQLIAAMLAFGLAGDELVDSTLQATRWTIEQSASYGLEGPTFTAVVVTAARLMGPATLLICVFMGLAALIAGFSQTQLNFTFKALAPKLERVNPITRLAQVFHPKKFSINILLATAKVVLGSAVIGAIFAPAVPAIAELAFAPLSAARVFVGDHLYTSLLATTAILGAIAVPDFIWQKSQLTEQMKMTRDEFKRDHEEQEGKPLYKQRRRAMHRELSLNRVLQSVPEADVIVTNPTHFAIALRYRPGEDAAPIVTAKGVDNMAMNIRRIARRAGVPIIENRVLARTLWRRVRVGQRVPDTLFQAVAAVLARVYKIRGGRRKTPARQGGTKRAGTSRVR